MSRDKKAARQEEPVQQQTPVQPQQQAPAYSQPQQQPAFKMPSFQPQQGFGSTQQGTFTSNVPKKDIQIPDFLKNRR